MLVSLVQRIPFEVAVEPVPPPRLKAEGSSMVLNAETLEAIEEVRRMKENPSLGKSYTNVDQMMKELLA